MKKGLFLLFLVLCFASFARAQQKWTLSAAATTCTTSNTSCLIYLVDAASGGATFTVGANASGNTIQFEATGDGGATWVALNATPSNSTTAATSTTSTGTWQANVAGYTAVRLRMSTLVSGTATVSIITSIASARAGGGGGLAPNVPGIPTYNGPNIVYASNYGVKANGFRYTDCSFVNTSKNVVCGLTPLEGDIPFTSAMCNTGPGGGGWLVFGTNGPPTAFLASATAILPVGTITTCTDATHISVSNAATASCTSTLNSDNCQLFIAPNDDSAALLAAANAAFLNKGPSCGTLILPQGYEWLQSPPNNNAWVCDYLGTANGAALGGLVVGYGLTGSVLVPAPNAAWTGLGGNSGMFFFSSATRGTGWHYRHFSIDGMGQYATLAGTGASQGALALNQNSDAIDVGVYGWGIGVGILSFGGGDAAEAVIDHCYVNAGSTDAISAGSYTKITNTAMFWNNGTGNLVSSGTHVTSLNNTYDNSTSTSNVVVTGGDFTSTSDLILAVSNTGGIFLNVTSASAIVHVSHMRIGSPNANNTIGIQTIAGSKLYLTDTQVNLGTGVGTQALNIAGTLFDGGNNSIATVAANSLTGTVVPYRGSTYAFDLSLPTVAGTGACATNSTLHGTIYWGSFACTGTTGAATLTITPGTTANTRFRCAASDITTTADTLQPTVPGSPTTTCTFSSAAIASNDVITFDITPF